MRRDGPERTLAVESATQASSNRPRDGSHWDYGACRASRVAFQIGKTTVSDDELVASVCDGGKASFVVDAPSNRRVGRTRLHHHCHGPSDIVEEWKGSGGIPHEPVRSSGVETDFALFNPNGRFQSQ